MLTAPLRRCTRIRHIHGAAAINHTNSWHVIYGFERNLRCYSSKDKSCCPDSPQTEGKKVEPWPKPDPPPPAWRCQCPKEPQPPNYDPYRIKVPDIVVPPIPTSNAKWIGVVFTVDQPNKESGPAVSQKPAGQQNPGASPETEALEEEEEEEAQDEGFFARLGKFFGLGKGKKGGGVMMEVPTEDGSEPFKSSDIKFAMNSELQDLFHDSHIIHPDYWKAKAKRGLHAAASGEALPRLGYHGKSKYKYAFHEPWKPLDRVTLMAQAEKEELEVVGAVQAAEKSE